MHSLSCSDLYCGFVVRCGSTHALLDLAGHGQESLLDVGGVLGGGLEEGDAEAVSEFLRLISVMLIWERQRVMLVPHGVEQLMLCM